MLAATMTPALLGAQSQTEPMVTLMKSGLQTVFPGHALSVTISEVGSPSSASEITIEFRDGADRRRAFRSGTLLRNQPVQLQVAVPAGVSSQQLRLILKITPVIDAEGSEPIVGVEDITLATGTVEPKPAPLPVPRGGAEAYCGGWIVTWFTLQQAGQSPN
jgi:hypothetical protein